MSGHSKWATTKHRRAVNDAKRGKPFTHLIKDIEVAAHTGGGDPTGNPTSFDAIQETKRSSVPADNIDRTVKRGPGDGVDAVSYESITYEGYASGDVAVLIECLTDNRNHAASEVRIALTRSGRQLVDPGSVAYMFAHKGVVEVPSEGVSEDDALAVVLEVGVEEVKDKGESFSVYCEPSDVVAMRLALQDAGIEYNSTEIRFVPSMKVEIDAEGVRKALKVVGALENCNDIRSVFSNFDVPETVMIELEAGG